MQERDNMKKRILVLGLAAVMALSCVACGGGKKDDTETNSEATKNELQDFEAVNLDDGKAGAVYSLSFTDGPSYEEATLPEKHFLGASAAFSGMKMDNITIQLAYATESVEMIDIHSLTTAHPEWFTKDGVHPNTQGAKAIAEAVAEAIQE